MKALKILGWVTAATVAFTVLRNFGDIRRYIKIERM